MGKTSAEKSNSVDLLIENAEVKPRDRFVGISPDFQMIFILWVSTRLLLVFVTYLAEELGLFDHPMGFTGYVMSWQRWDANWYMLISREGYASPTHTAFYPLFPLAVRGLSWLLGDGHGPKFPQANPLRLLVGMGISNVGLFFGLLAIAKLAELDRADEDKDAGQRAVGLLLTFPLAFVFAGAFTEGVFLAFVAGALLTARRGQWWWTSLLAGLAGLTRPTGIVLVLPLAWEYARQNGWLQHLSMKKITWRSLTKGALAVLSAPLATAVYFAFVFFRFGDFFLPVRAQTVFWDRHPQSQLQTLAEALQRLFSRSDTGLLAFNLLIVVGALMVTLLNIKRVPMMYSLFSLGLVYLTTAAPALSQGDLLWSSSRHLALAVPVFLALTHWTAHRQRLELILFGGGFMLQAVLLIGFFQGKPVV